MEVRGILSFFNTPDGQGRLPKTEKRRRSLTTCLTAFGFDPTPKRALTATTELAGRPVLYNKLGWTFKPVVGSSWQP